MELLKKRFDQFGVKTEIIIDGEGVGYRSLSELFISRRAYALAIGQNHPTVDGRILLDFSNVRRYDYENHANL